MKISASVYSNKDRELPDLIRELDAHKIDSFHIDCLDEPRVFNDIQAIRKISNTPIDLHMITARPSEYFEQLKTADIEAVTWQLEDLPNSFSFPELPVTRQGLAIVSSTALEALQPFVEDIDFVLMMTTEPGKSGGTFNRENFSRIRKLRSLYPGLHVFVDGGVNQEVSFILRNLGVEQIVSGSYLVNGPFLGASLLSLKEGEGKGHFHVEDIMIAKEDLPVVSISSTNPKQLILKMESGGKGFVLVEDDRGKLAGICSNADLRRAVIRHFDNLEDVSLEALINPKPIVAKASQHISEMVDTVKGLNFIILFLPVTNDEGKLLGAITFNDLIKGEL